MFFEGDLTTTQETNFLNGNETVLSETGGFIHSSNRKLVRVVPDSFQEINLNLSIE